MVPPTYGRVAEVTPTATGEETEQMPNEIAQTTTATEAQTAQGTTTSTAENPVAQEIARAVASAFESQRNGMFADIRKMVEGIAKGKAPATQTAQAEQTKATVQQPSADDFKSVLARERAFSDALADHQGVTKPQRDLLRELFDSHQPDVSEVGDWMGKRVAAFGQTSTATTNATTTSNTTQQQGAAPVTRPISDGGTPATTSAAESDDAPVWTWTKDRLDRFVRNHKGGVSGANAEIRARMTSQARGMTFALPRPR